MMLDVKSRVFKKGYSLLAAAGLSFGFFAISAYSAEKSDSKPNHVSSGAAANAAAPAHLNAAEPSAVHGQKSNNNPSEATPDSKVKSNAKRSKRVKTASKLTRRELSNKNKVRIAGAKSNSDKPNSQDLKLSEGSEGAESEGPEGAGSEPSDRKQSDRSSQEPGRSGASDSGAGDTAAPDVDKSIELFRDSNIALPAPVSETPAAKAPASNSNRNSRPSASSASAPSVAGTAGGLVLRAPSTVPRNGLVVVQVELWKNGAPSKASSGPLNLAVKAGTGAFYTLASSGQTSTTSLTIPSGHSAAKVYYKQPSVAGTVDNLEVSDPSTLWSKATASVTSVALGTSGAFDTSFNSNGIVTGPNSITSPVALEKSADGYIYVLGSNSAGNNDVKVAKFDLNGALVDAYGTQGVASLSIGSGTDLPQAMAFQNDGKLLIAGSTVSGSNGTKDFFIARVTTGGILDTTFGVSGVKTYEFHANKDEAAHGIAVQSDGKIVVAGYGMDTSNNIIITRLETNGAFDPAYGNNGSTELSVSTLVGLNNDDRVTSLILDANDVAYIGVSYQKTGSPSMNSAIVAINSQGALQSSFGASGVVETNQSAIGWGFPAVVLDLSSAGNLMAMLWKNNGTNQYHHAIQQYQTSDGTLVAAFGTAGTAHHDVGSINHYVYGMALLPDGGALTTGQDYNSATANFEIGVAKFSSTGALDSTFATAGYKQFASGAEYAIGKDLVLSNHGRVIVLGTEISTGYVATGVWKLFSIWH